MGEGRWICGFPWEESAQQDGSLAAVGQQGSSPVHLKGSGLPTCRWVGICQWCAMISMRMTNANLVQEQRVLMCYPPDFSLCPYGRAHCGFLTVTEVADMVGLAVFRGNLTPFWGLEVLEQ